MMQFIDPFLLSTGHIKKYPCVGFLFHDFDIKYSKHSDTGITKKRQFLQTCQGSTDALSKCPASGRLIKEPLNKSPGWVVVLAPDPSAPDPDPDPDQPSPDPSDHIEEILSPLKLLPLPHHPRARLPRSRSHYCSC